VRAPPRELDAQKRFLGPGIYVVHKIPTENSPGAEVRSPSDPGPRTIFVSHTASAGLHGPPRPAGAVHGASAWDHGPGGV
jgi:hypothetical protein